MTILTGPIDDLPIFGVPGHVDALGDLTIENLSGENIDEVHVGIQEDYDSANPEPLILDGTQLTLLAGTLNGSPPAGFHSTSAVRATVTSTPVAVCSTGPQPHIGSWKCGVRVKSNSATTRVRLSWRVGGGPWTPEAWKLLPVPLTQVWYELALGSIPIGRVPGVHSWEGRIEAYDSATSANFHVNFVDFMPARSAKVSTPPVIETSTAFSAQSGFDTESEAITGDTLDDGVNVWEGAGDADDFVRSGASGGVATRDAVSDADIDTGRYVVASGTSALTDIVASVDFKRSVGSVTLAQGILLRYTDSSNWFMVTTSPTDSDILVRKRVAGTVTTLAELDGLNVGTDSWKTLRVRVDADGTWAVWQQSQGGGLIQRGGGKDPSLDVGGTLPSGKVGMYDAHPSSGAVTRTYDNFAAWVPEIDHALWSGQTASLTHEKYTRENSGGTASGKLPIVGRYLTIPPSTRADREHRLVVRTRRYAIDEGLPSDGLTDDLDVSLLATPRVVLVR